MLEPELRPLLLLVLLEPELSGVLLLSARLLELSPAESVEPEKELLLSDVLLWLLSPLLLEVAVLLV